VITSRAADIFKSNALKNGLVVCEIDEAAHAALLDREDLEVTVDVVNQTVTAGNITASFKLDPFARTCLIEGVDPLGLSSSTSADAIARFEQGPRGMSQSILILPGDGIGPEVAARRRPVWKRSPSLKGWNSPSPKPRSAARESTPAASPCPKTRWKAAEARRDLPRRGGRAAMG
jgi:hypothetical protein